MDATVRPPRPATTTAGVRPSGAWRAIRWPMAAVALLAAQVASSGAAQAQAVYRCGHQYSHAPCANAVVVDVADPRSAQQTADGLWIAERERRLAASMRRDRLDAARAAADAPAISLGGRAPRERGPRTRLVSFGALQAAAPYP